MPLPQENIRARTGDFGNVCMLTCCFRRRLEAGQRLEAVESNLGGGIQI